VTIEGAITEDDIANYLANTPGFFERHAELLASVQLTSPHGGRAVSLQERQMEMLRERIRAHEAQIMDMVRHGRENMTIADRLHRFVRTLLVARSPAGLPGDVTAAIQHEFMVPQAALRIWNADDAYEGLPFTAEVTAETQSFVASLVAPYCGVNSGFEAVGWLDDPESVMSVALIPLTIGAAPFGLMVLGSPDPTRYTADMGTDFLVRLGELVSAALSRLCTPE
jgi:hypothetical protein